MLLTDRPTPHHNARLGPANGNFWGKLVERDGCWEWAGKLRKDRYARVESGGLSKLVHRLAYELAVGPIPDGMCVCHSCDNPPCCNPAHLFLGTHADNMHDMYAKGRRRAVSGEEHPRSRFTEDQVREMRRAYVDDGATQVELATRFGVRQAVVSGIVRGLTWKHAGGPIASDKYLNTVKHARIRSSEEAAKKPRVNGRFVKAEVITTAAHSRHHAAEKPRVRGRFVRRDMAEATT